MVHDDADAMEVCWTLGHHHLICSRDFSAFISQFTDAAQREANEKFAIRDRRECCERF